VKPTSIDTRAPEQPREDVPAELVEPEEVRARRTLEPALEILVHRPVPGQERAEERHQEQDPDRRGGEAQPLRHARPRPLGTITR